MIILNFFKFLKFSLLAFFFLNISYSFAFEKNNFKEYLINPSIYDNNNIGFTYPFGHNVSDIDNDGNLDITLCDNINETYSKSENSQIAYCYLFKGDGNGLFKRILIHVELGYLERLDTADLNNDQIKEIIVVNNKFGGATILSSRENINIPWNMTALDWGSKIMPRSYDVDLGDLDNDGCEDIVVGGYTGKSIIIYKNPCYKIEKNFFTDTKNFISKRIGILSYKYINRTFKNWSSFVVDLGMITVRTVKLIDYDLDGDLDILATSEGREIHQRSFYKSDGAFVKILVNPGKIHNNWKEIILDDNSLGSGQSSFCDIDNDGDLDIIVPYGLREKLLNKKEHNISVFINNNGKFERKIIYYIPFIFEVECADLDKDGQADIVYTAHDSGSKIDLLGDRIGILYKHNTWKNLILKNEWTAANDVSLKDINNDGWIDIIATADNGNGFNRRSGGSELIWWKNTLKIAK